MAKPVDTTALEAPLPAWFFGPYRRDMTQDEKRAFINAMSSFDFPTLLTFLPPPPASTRFTNPPPDIGTIYFVGPEGGPIKIGFASRLHMRLKDLRSANALPLVVHASVQGPPRLERQYHKRFAEHRLHGEWFDPHPDILAEIARLSA